MPKDVGAYLAEQQKKSSGDISAEWAKLEELYTKKYLNCFMIVKNDSAVNTILDSYKYSSFYEQLFMLMLDNLKYQLFVRVEIIFSFMPKKLVRGNIW